GAVWAGGCTVGNGMVQTSLFSYQGWVGIVAIALGVGLAAKIWLKPDQPYNPQDVQDAPTAQDGSAAVPSAPSVASGVPAGGVLTAPALDASALGVVAASDGGGLTDLGDGRWRMDTLGAVCPFPLIEAKDAIKRVGVGEELVIEFDCTQATDALPRWAATDGHEVTQFETAGDAGWVIAVKKGE
ncbi:MAG: sulfurtransferase TusA family protein, partial [Corynebacterium sp.]|nr:sulfurtransferase TusA family protein [Corynebacterium sp.]